MGNIILIEDNPGVREVLLSAFMRHGHVASVAGNCIEPGLTDTCDLGCCAGGIRADVALIAVIAPRQCSGVETALKALKRWPRVRILLTSTSPMELWPERAKRLVRDLPADSWAFLPKPFTIPHLMRIVERMMS